MEGEPGEVGQAHPNAALPGRTVPEDGSTVNGQKLAFYRLQQPSGLDNHIKVTRMKTERKQGPLSLPAHQIMKCCDT